MNSLKYILLLIFAFAPVPRLVASESTNMALVAFYAQGETGEKRLMPATFLYYKGRGYFCVHSSIVRMTTEPEAYIARNCESEPEYELVDQCVDWSGMLFMNPYIAIFHVTDSFQIAKRQGKIPVELIFDLESPMFQNDQFESVSICRAGPGAYGSLKLSVVDQVTYKDNELKKDKLLGLSGFYYFLVNKDRIADSIGSPVFRQKGATREFVGVYTFAFEANYDVQASYVCVSDLQMLIDKHGQ